MNLMSVKNLTFVWMYPVPICLVLVYFCIEQHSEVDEINYSSVWCQHRLTDSKLCKFTNVCYNPKFSSFLFFFSNLSVIRGLYEYDDFKNIQLSSVNFHNKFVANISIINSTYYPVESVRHIRKGLLFSRFKPDNIMHVIHDDLLPVYLTLQEICLGNMISCEKNYHLIFHDNYQKGPYFDFYKMFSSFEPIFLSAATDVLCFGELHMGLVQDSIFYQYGFGQVQGPVTNDKITGNDIKQFSSFISNKLDVETQEFDKTDIVLISRKKNRRILNEESLMKMLEVACKELKYSQTCKVVALDLYENKTNVVIKAVRQASMLVGMHGAEMIFSIFLKEKSTVVELFPFGIQPHVVSFVKSLSEIEGIHFNYIYWENLFRSHSIFPVGADSFHGGITHLPLAVQDEIMRAEKVPAVKCCNDPTYLHYMYQDTLVNPRFEQFLMFQLLKKKIESKQYNIYDKWFFPGVVNNVSCLIDHSLGHLNLSWTKPFNTGVEPLRYDVSVYNVGLMYTIDTEHTTLSVNVSSEIKEFKFEVWISAVIVRTKATSKDIYIKCN